MNRNWRRVGLVAGIVALVGVLGFGAVAFADTPDDATGWRVDLHTRVQEAIASALGISVDEYETVVETAHDQVIDEFVAEGLLTEEQAARMEEFGQMRGNFEGMPFADRLGGRMGGRGGKDAWGRVGFGGWDLNINEIAAEQLGLEPADLMTAVHEGMTIAELAEQQGVELQTIADAYLAEVTEKVNQAVADEKLTQEQADTILANAEQRISDWLENGCQVGPMGGFEGRPGPWTVSVG